MNNSSLERDSSFSPIISGVSFLIVFNLLFNILNFFSVVLLSCSKVLSTKSLISFDCISELRKPATPLSVITPKLYPHSLFQIYPSVYKKRDI